MNRLTLISVALCAVAAPASASAMTLFESVPDITETLGGYCSPCSYIPQVVGQRFTISTPSDANTIMFNMREQSPPYEVNAVSVSIFSDDGSGVVGTSVFQRTYDISEYESIFSLGEFDRVISVSLGELALLGSYSIFLNGPVEAAIPFYENASGGIFTQTSTPNGPLTGTPYFDTGTALGVRMIGSVTSLVPEPSAWAMMILGFGAVGYAMRCRTKVALRLS